MFARLRTFALVGGGSEADALVSFAKRNQARRLFFILLTTGDAAADAADVRGLARA